MNTNTSQYHAEVLLVRLHEMIASGHGDSEQADEVRDELGYYVPQLPLERQDILADASGDLYMLSHRERLLDAPTTIKTAKEWLVNMGDAWQQAESVRILVLLRHCKRRAAENRMGPSVARPRSAYQRARAYEDLGFGYIALAFIKFAHELSPKDINYLTLMLMLSARVGADDFFPRSVEIIMDETSSHRPVIAAAHVVLATLQDGHGEHHRALLAALATRLRAALYAERVAANSLISVVKLARSLLAFTLAITGNMPEAAKVLQELLDSGVSSAAGQKIEAVLRRPDGENEAFRIRFSDYYDMINNLSKDSEETLVPAA